MIQYLTMIRLVKYLLVLKTLVASAIGTDMDEEGEFSFPTLNPMTNFQVQPFLSNPTGWHAGAHAMLKTKSQTSFFQ